MNDEKRNSEGYIDLTAFKAIKAVHGAETKAYHCYKTMLNVAKLAGMKICGDIILMDATGTKHSGKTLTARRAADAESMSSVWKDS